MAPLGLPISSANCYGSSRISRSSRPVLFNQGSVYDHSIRLILGSNLSREGRLRITAIKGFSVKGELISSSEMAQAVGSSTAHFRAIDGTKETCFPVLKAA